MRKTQRIIFIQCIQFFAALLCHFTSLRNRLSAAAHAAARTCHDFYKIVFCFAALYFFHKLSCIPQSVYDSCLNRYAGDLQACFFDSVKAAYNAEQIWFWIFPF